ncbi:PREDICTED: uncharacterized protein LOC106539457 isoform X2 [Thamnophis sirtalis]|uniref:Uncharacterized protein LOC106539457 isoform X2 n=1 Tax=Thamnophis sirtalis TaxID=35019 RepID=A0A6I9X359_9SAUR|nr:PREDICTED: uncharacterized protein LOC106539457 isoform X2 [Thamnophis sirtalis]
MNAPPAPESRPYSTNPRPFFYARPTAHQPFPNPWLVGPMYNPYGMPASGLRSGNPYFQCYSVPSHEYPGYLVPQPPMHMRIRRPYFGGPPSSPMVYQVPRFRHGFPMMYQPQNPVKRTENKETQTDFGESESGAKTPVKQDIGTKGYDVGNTENTAYIASDTPKETESFLGKTDKTTSSAMSDRELAKNSSGLVPFRSLPPAGYAIEKEEVRIQYANDGAPAIQLWKSFKETIPLYEMAQKQAPKNIVQRDILACSSCEGVAYEPHEEGELPPCIPFSEEQKVPEGMQKKQPLCKENPDSEKQIVINYRAIGPMDEAGTVQLAEPSGLDHSGIRQDVLMAKIPPGFKKSSGSKAPQEVSNHIRQRKLFPSDMEMTNDAYLPQKLSECNDMNNENWNTSEKIQWCDDSEKYLPSESWLACVDNMDPNYNYEKYLFRRKRPNLLSITSDDMSSIEEGASTENSSVSIIVPDHLLPKGLCTFKKNRDGLGIGQIRSGGTLNEDEEVMGIEQATSEHSQNLKINSRVKVKEIPSQIKKMSILPRCSKDKHLYCLQKITSSSPSDADDSEEYWVMEPEEYEEQETDEEYFVEEDMPYEILNPDKSGLGQQTAQKVFWRIPKNAVPPHVINWPVQEKMSGLPTKLQKEQNEDLCDDYNICFMRPTVQQLELLEHRKNPQKCSGWLQEENRRTGPDEYWIKSGARPRSASLKPGDLSPTATKEKDILEVFPFASDDIYMECPKNKGVHKPPHKRRDTRCETAEVREKPKITYHKGCEAKKPPYKR